MEQEAQNFSNASVRQLLDADRRTYDQRADGQPLDAAIAAALRQKPWHGRLAFEVLQTIKTLGEALELGGGFLSLP